MVNQPVERSLPEFRTLDPFVLTEESSAEVSIDIGSLPLPYVEKTPSTVVDIKECCKHQIRSLLNKEEQLSEEDQDALDDGFFLCDLNVIANKLVAWRHLFPRVKPFFAIKCNPDVNVAGVLGQQQGLCGFDCASLSEIRLALDACGLPIQRSSTDGFKSRRIVYANPQRAEEALDVALQSLGVEALTFDGLEELRKVRRAHNRKIKNNTIKNQDGGTADTSILPPEMILRILVPDSTSTVPLGEKFGCQPTKIEILVREAISLGLPIIGVSFHCGSGCHDPKAYENAIRLARESMDQINSIQPGQKCRLLDIGGGFPGVDGVGGDRFCGQTVSTKANEESAKDFAEVVTPLLDELFPIDSQCPTQIISEPGRYFVESAFVLCSRIYSVQIDRRSEDQSRHYYISCGVHGVFKDVLLCGESFVPTPLQIEETGQDGILRKSTVHGPSGEENDIILRDYLLPTLKVGDWLIFDRMGAYTLSIASRSGRIPIRYVMG